MISGLHKTKVIGTILIEIINCSICLFKYSKIVISKKKRKKKKFFQYTKVTKQPQIWHYQFSIVTAFMWKYLHLKQFQ